MELAFEVDKITESIEDTETGAVLKTLVLPMDESDLRNINKKNGWLFDWKLEFSYHERQVSKLVTFKEPNVVHGLVSLEMKESFVYMHLIESAPCNLGKGKKYLGVCGNLTAYGCKMSAEHGFDGEIAFISKTELISHYEKTLGAVHIGGNRMIVYKDRAMFLLNKYFPEMEVF